MTIGYPSVRIDDGNALHHLWCNNGTWWVHYTLHFDHRKRRIRRSLRTRRAEEAIERRDALLARLARDGEPVPERRRGLPAPAGAEGTTAVRLAGAAAARARVPGDPRRFLAAARPDA